MVPSCYHYGKDKNENERLFYIEYAAKYGWSRSVLIHQIELNLYKRQGKSINNFKEKLPSPHSDLANQTLKDPYIFDFLSIGNEAHEREIEKSLIVHMEKFLIELGDGFAFVGRQYHLEVSGKDFYIDLLFYHLKLRSYIVIELKADEFLPEHAGKMNFYLSAVDRLLHPHIFWGHIEKAVCQDNTNKHKKEIESISTFFPNRFRLVLKFGNRNFNRPLIIFDTSTTATFLNKVFSTGHDLQGNVAIILDDFQSNAPRKTPKIVIHDPKCHKIAFIHD